MVMEGRSVVARGPEGVAAKGQQAGVLGVLRLPCILIVAVLTETSVFLKFIDLHAKKRPFCYYVCEFKKNQLPRPVKMHQGAKHRTEVLE